MPTHSKELYSNKELGSPTSTTTSLTLTSDPAPNVDIERPRSPIPRFLNVISKKLRSRSPSPAPPQQKTPRATTPQPEQSAQPSTMGRSSSPATSMPPRQSSQDSTNSIKRQSSDRSQFEKLTYGRHSSQWIFGDFSVTGTVREVFHKRSDSSNNS